MYQIYCDNELLYDPRDETLAIIEGKVSLETNKTGELRFALPICHPFAGRIKKLTSVLRVMINEEELFCGRLLDVETDMYGTGTYTCEGEMAYLLDSIQRPKEYHDLTPRSYLQDKLAQHNSQVEESKRFSLGIVEKPAMNYDARQDNQYTSTLSTIMDKLVSSNGGYLRVRKEEGIRYLDYLESYGRTSGQIIRFGENILDLTEHLSASDIITVLIPLGKAPDGAKEGERLTIASVNNGKDYLENAEAIALYGRIVGANEWQDVTVPANLKAKGQEYLIRMRNLATTIELTAIDLHLADVDIDQIRLGDMIRAVSKPHGLDRYMLVSKREYDLLNPEEDKIVLGDTISTLTEKQAALQKSVEQQKDAAASVEKLKASVQTVEKDIDSTKQAVTAIDGKVQVLETSATETQKRLQEIQNTMTGISQTLEGLSVQDEAFQAILDDILARLENLEGGGIS
ncbi:phage tail protein [[Clostridium] scindens]|uniref:phage tail protein n=1 Tax=Clostridium scindens (strain JCM 10418 / VPI 12708) TaxID=29347 RepID=UPI002096C9E3|nr:phage tail spike protein [[Clostridium] scindens]MCO7172563.1 phage tail protein [[Clostridium] scindens]